MALSEPFPRPVRRHHIRRYFFHSRKEQAFAIAFSLPEFADFSFFFFGFFFRQVLAFIFNHHHTPVFQFGNKVGVKAACRNGQAKCAGVTTLQVANPKFNLGVLVYGLRAFKLFPFIFQVTHEWEVVVFELIL